MGAGAASSARITTLERDACGEGEAGFRGCEVGTGG